MNSSGIQFENSLASLSVEMNIKATSMKKISTTAKTANIAATAKINVPASARGCTLLTLMPSLGLLGMNFIESGVKSFLFQSDGGTKCEHFNPGDTFAFATGIGQT